MRFLRRERISYFKLQLVSNRTGIAALPILCYALALSTVQNANNYHLPGYTIHNHKTLNKIHVLLFLSV